MTSSNAERQRHRIAMVCDFFFPNLGGVENHIYSLSQKLIERGHKVIIITHQYNGNMRQGVRYLPGPLKVYYCPIVPMGPSANVALPTFTATLPLMRHILLREQIDIVHAHQATSTMGNECIVYASMMGLAAIYTDHSLFGFNDIASVILNRVLQVTLCTIDAAICVSHTCRDNFILRTKLTKQHPRRKLLENRNPFQPQVHVIPNAVSPSQFLPLCKEESVPQSATIDNGNNRIKVVVVSRLVYRKGVDLLVGIIPNVCRAIDTVDFIVAGDGNKLLQLQEMVERENIQHRVEFLGSVQHAQVRNVLVRGHVFLNCSLTESFCIAILEAASCGLLVVSTNVGGVPEVLPADDMILLAHPNVPDMVNCVIKAIERQTNSPIDRWHTHERVKQMYSWERVAVETEHVYDYVRTCPRRSFLQRLMCYNTSLRGFTGYAVCFLVLIVEAWYRCVAWYQPQHQIDCVPDLALASNTNIAIRKTKL